MVWFAAIVVAFSAAVSCNYLTLTARHLIQTLPTLEKNRKKRNREGMEGEKKKKSREGKKG